MGSFGEQLRQAREARQITLQEIAATTKISCRALQALEDEHFSQLPGGIFNKGFVRAYARYVGLDEDKMLAAYMAAAKVEGSEADIQVISSQVAAANSAARGSSWNGTTLMGILALLVALGLGAVWLKEHRKEAREQAAATEAASEASQTNNPAPGMGAPPMVVPDAPGGSAAAGQSATANPGAGSSTAPNAVPDAAPNAASNAVPAAAQSSAANAKPVDEQEAPIEVTISATQPAWISVHSDGKAVESVTLDPAKPETTKRSYKAKERLTLVVGNLGGLSVTYNGKPEGVLGKAGQSARLTFTPRGMEKQ